MKKTNEKSKSERLSSQAHFLHHRCQDFVKKPYKLSQNIEQTHPVLTYHHHHHHHHHRTVPLTSTTLLSPSETPATPTADTSLSSHSSLKKKENERPPYKWMQFQTNSQVKSVDIRQSVINGTQRLAK